MSGGPTVRVFWLPKQGHRADEYEDAYAFSRGRALPWRAAVADGATEAAFAGAWARALVEGFVAEGPTLPEAFSAILRRRQAGWQAELAARAQALPWYAAAKAEQGAFAAFLGMTLHADGRWRALAVGDCCLFHVRDDATLRTWPFDAPEQFDHHPMLLPSRTTAAMPELQTTSGTWKPGDAFLLASDALAAWLLRTDPPAMLSLSEESFRVRVVEARGGGILRNDDVTLVVVRCPLSVVR